MPYYDAIFKKMKHMNLNQFNKKSTVTSIEFFRRELFSSNILMQNRVYEMCIVFPLPVHEL